MKTRVRATLMAMAFMAAPVAATAQDPGERAPAERAWAFGAAGALPIEMVLRHRDELGLSGDQVARLETIRTRVEEQNRPLIEQLRAQMPAARGETIREWRGGPGPQGQAMTPERRAQSEERMARRGARLTPEQGEALRERTGQREVDLTPEQREALRGEWRQRAAAMTPEQRDRLRSELERRIGEAQPLMQQIRANSMAAATEAREVLTAEQQDRMRELFREHAEGRRIGARPHPTFPGAGAGR